MPQIIDEKMLQILFDWTAETIAVGETIGRPLYVSETLNAESSQVSRIDDVRILVVDAMRPVPKEWKDLSKEFLNLNNAAGLTLDHVILLHKDWNGSPATLRHELRHVHQVEQCGSWDIFLREYLDQVLTCGYSEAPFEIDARAFESRQ